MYVWVVPDILNSSFEPHLCMPYPFFGGAHILGPADQQTFSAFQQKGMDPQVVKRRWGQNRPRGCLLPGCGKHALSLAALQDVSYNFWKITMQERVQLLQAQLGDDPTSITKYYIGDQQVCFANFCVKLGTSQPAVRKLIKGTLEFRTRGMKNVKENAAESSTVTIYLKGYSMSRQVS